MKQWMGVDVGDSTIKAALFEPGSGQIQMLGGAGTRLDSSIAFVSQQSGGARTGKAVFPIDDKFASTHPDALVFTGLKRALLPLREFNEIDALMAPVFEHFRRQAGSGEVYLSLVVSAEYPVALCHALTQVALGAGFTTCSYVHELTAAVLACLPNWRKDSRRWTTLEAGQHVWIFDSGAVDLNVGLVRVQRSGDAISISHLAGDRLAGLGSGDEDPIGMEAFPERLNQTMAEMRSVLDVELGADKAWAIFSGGGSTTDRARAFLGGRNGQAANTAEPIAPAQVLASGAAVHAAMLSDAVGLRFGTIEARRILGLCVELSEDVNFLPFTITGHKPPYDFEGAYRFETDSRPLEITLGAALPGGQRSAAVQSFLVNKEDLSALTPVGVMIRGHLDTWASGRVSVHDLHSGTKLKESNFRLP